MAGQIVSTLYSSQKKSVVCASTSDYFITVIASADSPGPGTLVTKQSHARKLAEAHAINTADIFGRKLKCTCPKKCSIQVFHWTIDNKVIGSFIPPILKIIPKGGKFSPKGGASVPLNKSTAFAMHIEQLSATCGWRPGVWKVPKKKKKKKLGKWKKLVKGK